MSARRRSRHEAIWSAAPSAVVLLDADGRITDANPAAERVMGVPPRVLGGAVFAGLFLDTRVQAWLSHLAAGVGDHSMIQAPLRDGRLLELRGSDRLHDRDLRVVLVGLADVTSYAEVVRGLETRSLHDPLTGLPTRALLEDRLRQARRTSKVSSVLFTDLDHFKHVNDRYGHAAGDHVLRVIADRMRATVRSTATVARLGGDEFVVLLPGDGEDVAEAVATRLVEVMRAPIPLDGAVVLAVTACVGVATTEGAFSTETVLRHADIALYRAKAAGRDGKVVFRPEMADWEPAVRRDAETLAVLRRKNAELERLVRTDEVTGISNVRSYRERLYEIHGEAVRSGRPYSLVFCDLDHFGPLNKRRGQQAGDDVLRRVARTLVDHARAGDEVYRRGGEELVVLLPDTPQVAAVDAAERLRHAVEGLALENGSAPDTPIVTMSAGVATLDPCRHHSAEDVEYDADRAMVQAKDRGRNRIITSPAG